MILFCSTASLTQPISGLFPRNSNPLPPPPALPGQDGGDDVPHVVSGGGLLPGHRVRGADGGAGRTAHVRTQRAQRRRAGGGRRKEGGGGGGSGGEGGKVAARGGPEMLMEEKNIYCVVVLGHSDPTKN